MTKSKLRIISFKILKILLWMLASFVFLFLVVVILLQFSAVQTRIIDRITSTLSERTQSHISIDRVAVRFPKSVGLKGLYAEDEKGDTLIYAGSIFVDIGMLGLLRNQINVNSLEITNVTANMLRNEPDSTFNYQFIIDAFSEEDTAESEEENNTPESQNNGDFKINVDRVKLRDIRYKMEDYFSGFYMMAELGSLDTRLRPADFLQQKFHTEDLMFKDIWLNIEIKPARVPSPEPTDEGMQELDIFTSLLSLQNTQFMFSSFDGTRIHINTEEIAITPNEIKLHEYLIDIKDLITHNLTADFQTPLQPSPNGVSEHNTNIQASPKDESEAFHFSFSEIMDWNVNLENLSINNSHFFMQQGESPYNPREFDPAHLQIENIDLQASDIAVSPDALAIRINNLSSDFSESFSIKTLSADIDFGNRAQISNFDLTTTQSQLSLSFSSDGSLLEFGSDALMQYNYEVTIAESHIRDDLSWLIPAMNEYYFNWPGNQGIKLGGNLSGNTSDILIDSLWIGGPEFFTASIKGRLKDLQTPDSISVENLEFKLFAVPHKFFSNLPDSLQPDNIQLPEYIYVENKSHGSLKNFQTTLDLRTDLGNIALNATGEQTEDAQTGFSGSLNTTPLNIGKFLKAQDHFEQSPVIEFAFEGKTSSLEDTELEATLSIKDFDYQQHQYDDIDFYFSLKDSIAYAQSEYQDSLLAFSLDAHYGLFAEIPSVVTFLDLDYAQLGALGLTNEPILLRTHLNVDLILDPPDFFNGSILISHTQIASEGEIYNIPNMEVVSEASQEDYNLTIRSYFAQADFSGNFSPARIPEILSEHFSKYYDMPFAKAQQDSQENKMFELNLSIMPDEFFTEVLLPDLHDFDTLFLNLSYNSRANEMILEADLQNLKYAGIELSEFKLTADSDPGKMELNTHIETLIYNDMSLQGFKLNSTFEDETFDFSLGFNDPLENPLYSLSANVDKRDSLFTLSIKPDDLLLNGESWTIPENNRIEYAPGHIVITSFILEKDDSRLALNSRETEEGYTAIDIDFSAIDLGKLTEFAGSNAPPLGGIFQGELSLLNIFEQPTFLADLVIKDLSFDGDTLGTLELKAENPHQDLFEVAADLRSEVTSLQLTGSYRSGEETEMDFTINMDHLALKPLESFANESITHLSGYLSGEMRLTGNFENPEISGSLNINETSFRVPALNAGYFLRSEQINFDRQNIRFQNIALEDSAGRRATLNGDIGFAELSQLELDLSLNSRNFQLMNIDPEQNEPYHGRILMDTDLTLKGSQNNPTVEGRIKLNEGSSFNFTLPQSDPEAIGDEGIVEFIQDRDTLFMQMAMQAAETEELKSSFEVVDVSVNIEIDRQTNVKIIIDEYAGDFLQVRGGGLLSFGIYPGGRISLSGRYDISDGEYLLTFYDVVRRNFRIQSGSYMRWSGDPMDAQIEITAIHTVRTNAANLMAGMGTSQAESAALRRQFPFYVHLKMQGNLMEPQISFELELPPEHQAAMDGSLAARLEQINQNESELNKQVFALLILGTFIQDNPFAGLSGGGGLSSTARSSVSQILSQQLNRFSDRFIRGVDINFEVESFEDYADGQAVGRTELQMEVSRNFFNERVRVSVGGNIELEDDATRETDPGDIAGDFSIEYLITPEGNLRLKGFRTRNYGDIFDGQVVETGVSVIFSRSYNQFRELFKKKEEESSVPQENNSNP